jgi:hypothetical protein
MAAPVSQEVGPMLAPWRTIPLEPVVDNRPRCPRCGERLEEDAHLAPWCWEELLDAGPYWGNSGGSA